jgi:hypothetical protein
MIIIIPILFFIYLYEICGESKHCINCKNFIPYKNNKISSLGLCKIFGNKIKNGNKNEIVYNFADHCRNDENLCGKDALLHESIDLKQSTNLFVNNTNNTIVKATNDEIRKIIFDYYLFIRNINDW